MRTFIGEVAEAIYNKYGDDISSLNILFPSRRARLFFSDALSSIAARPLWQPAYLSVDDLMGEIAGMRVSDNIPLIIELYKVYSKYHDEPFDQFYFWGEMLLADFDTVDKYMIDASMLFMNVSDLKNIESDLSYLTQEQIDILRMFWRNMDTESGDSPEKRHFLKIWNSLPAIYADYRKCLGELGMAYQGMVYRAAADKLGESGVPDEFLSRRYVIAGFNALSESEKVVFDNLLKSEIAEFYWDYDQYYAGDRNQEAGLFIRENVSRFPSPDGFSGVKDFVKEKDITVVSAPSDAMQAKYVTGFLDELVSSGKVPGRDTAIVLTDENLLLPVLHSIPPAVSDINITMGYPLRQTPAYTFVERIVELQQHKKQRGTSTVFYHSDVTGILNHPYIQGAAGAAASEIAQGISRRKQIYVPAKYFSGNDMLSSVFQGIDAWEELADYIISCMDSAAAGLKPGSGDDMQREFIILITGHIYKLRNLLSGSGIDITRGVFLSLLRKTLQTLRIPYQGEPLAGIQVMGVLETRNLDFENVVILSANDDTFPGNLSSSSSFVPYNLRLAYGLPTPQHHEGVYAYYFYRLIQRAKKVHIVYSSKTDEKKTGEPSRYIYQLDYESPHKVVHKSIGLDVSFPLKKDYTVSKEGGVLDKLNAFLGQEAQKMLSPSAFYSYVECPLKFYFKSIAAIREEDEITEEVDLPMFGNIFHKASEIIYSGIKGRAGAQDILKTIMGTSLVDDAVSKAIRLEYFRDDDSVGEDEFGGTVTLIGDIIKKYLNMCLLAYDSSHDKFTVEDIEYRVDTFVGFDSGGETKKVRFGGIIDRVDALDNGLLRIVDYKTGSLAKGYVGFAGIDALFSGKPLERNSAVLQVFIYSLLLTGLTGKDIVPALYFIRYMNGESYSPFILEGSARDRREVLRFSAYRDKFAERFKNKLAEIFDPKVPFTRCSDTKTCEYCPYKEMCWL